MPVESPKHMHTTNSSFVSSTTLPSPFQPTFVMGIKAKIKQLVPSCLPTMGKGDVDATILWDWFVKCENFLRHKNTVPANMVKTVAYRMTGIHMICWLAANGPLLSEMDWDSYKDHLHALFLPSNWEYTMWMAILRMKQDSKPFSNFILDIMRRNNLLAGTNSFMNDDFIQNTIEAGMDVELTTECHHKNTNSITTFKAWMDETK
ncbi:hypothetical protein BDN71DRAFT_1506565 [Pleurotus eryngii]|uniref:Uncharacterized protein n=1 Tax=Pleurotus eryngii TaxID=5323 RepID=A0A9P5ZZR0_PLEER|nr:hypothetical protein BDN71DRAFT_1506565 [Pleurotus eryngii]